MIYTSDMTQTVIVSTASPFKFNSSVAKALFEDEADKKTSLSFWNFIGENGMGNTEA